MSMVVDLDWLNRLGIILNFLAGFMLAPDLIGRERLLKFENLLEIKLKSIIINLKKDASRKITKLSNKEKLFFSLLTIFYIGYVAYITFSSYSSYYNSLFIFDRKILLIFYIISFSLLITSYILFYFYLLKTRHGKLTAYRIIRYCIKLINNFENFINKDNTVISTLTFWGIIFFIFGNLLQFIATFKKD